jgi:hypothetical protein
MSCGAVILNRQNNKQDVLQANETRPSRVTGQGIVPIEIQLVGTPPSAPQGAPPNICHGRFDIIENPPP